LGTVLVAESVVVGEETEAQDLQEMDDEIEIQARVLKIGGRAWSDSRTWVRGQRGLQISGVERGILDVACRIPLRVPTGPQSRVLWGLRSKLIENGCPFLN
jgi:hypothetical protein